MNRIIFIAMLCFLVVSSASADTKLKDKAPAEATVAVNCTLGERITDALAEPAVALTIEISGICYEDVEILRNYVTLRGTDPLTDGIRPAPGGPEHSVITVFAAHNIDIENLSLTGATIGIGINASYLMSVRNCLIEINSIGVLGASGTGSLTVEDTVMAVTAGGEAKSGILLTHGSNLICTRCTIENRDAIRMQNGSHMYLNESSLRGTRDGVNASGGSRFVSNKFISPIPSTIEGESYALRLSSNASAFFQDDEITGRIRLSEKSVATFLGAHQVNPSNNFVNSGSSLVARNSTILNGDFSITDFSNLSLWVGSIIYGGLSCSRGADAYCDNPPDAQGGSNCGQCPNP